MIFAKSFSLLIILFTIAHRLLAKDRPAMEINTVKHDWHEYYPEEIKSFPNIYSNKAVFPLHGLLKLKKRNRDAQRQLWKHCAGLYDL